MRRILILLLGLPALAGCGGGKPAIAPGVAQTLATRADAVAASAAAGDACEATRNAATLQAATIRAINAHEIPPRYQEALQARTTELVAELQPECLPPVPASGDAPVLSPPFAEHGHGHGKGHGKDHGD